MTLTVKFQYRLLTIFAVLAAIAASAGVPAAAQTASLAEKAVLDMREDFRKGDNKQLAQLLPRAQGHVLEPLAAYWELRNRLDLASASEIRAFLAKYSGTYYEDRLRNDWLLQLGKQRDWVNLAAELPLYRMQDDREVKCYGLLLQHQQGKAVAEQVETAWLAQKEADDGCALAAKELLATEKMAPHVAWLRARWAMEANRSQAAVQAVNMLNPDWAGPVEQIFQSPARYLDDKLTAIRARTKEFVTLALVRLATSSYEDAAEQANKLRWRTQLTDEERSWVWAVIGKRAAQKLDDKAHTYFAKALPQHLNDDLLAWKTRAALRAGDWSAVAASIQAMSPQQQKDATWAYWLARAWQNTKPNGTETAMAAQALLSQIAGFSGFYEQLAYEALGSSLTPPPAPAALTPEEKKQAQQNPGLRRALEAIALGMRTEGNKEWNYTTNLHTPGGMNDRELLAAADLACSQAVWDRCINTSDRTKNSTDQSQRFPMPHKEAVIQRAREINLDPAYVYGLIRQESRFMVDARSGVGASGLMQVMPATASWTAKRIGMTDFKPHRITERDVNIAIGTAYLKLALDDFEGSKALATAAYNAGPSRPRSWRNGPQLEAAIWIENIPFAETRDYVKRV
ncbi:MAG: hypothetical protein RL323_2262, partial [Pseudomonadota bacterium]